MNKAELNSLYGKMVMKEILKNGTRFISEELIAAIADGMVYKPDTFSDLLGMATKYREEALMDGRRDRSLVVLTGAILEAYEEADHWNNDLENVFHRIAECADCMFTKMEVETDYIKGSDFEISFNWHRNALRDVFHLSNSFEYDKYELGLKSEQEIYDIMNNCIEELRRR